ncbi:MAG: peptidase [Clostridia bacterium]|nr:peptidase [Clostridia bacterium]
MKKLIALFTILTLLIGIFQMPGGVLADEKPQITLKQAIDIAKTTFDLKTEGLEFNSSYVENQNGFNVWSLSWNNAKTHNENINVSIDSAKGEVISYSWYSPYEQPKSRIPKYSKAEALQAAETFAAKLAGEKFKLTKFKENPNQEYYSKYSDVYTFEFVRIHDGIEVTQNNITVQLDRNTLKVRNFNTMWETQTLPSKAQAFGLDKAKELFKNKLGLELSYSFIYDNPNNEPKAILAYTLKNGNNPIDAISGDILTNMYRIYAGDKGGMAMETTAVAPITPQEQSVIDDNSKYITKEAAEQVFKQYMKLDENMKLERSNLYPGYQKVNATWNLEYKYISADGKFVKNMSAQIDAVTKEFKALYTYYSNQDNEKGKTALTKEQAKKLAEEFLMNVQPGKFKNSQLRESTDMFGIMPAYQNGFRFNYIRVENGIPCPSNALTVTINEYTGEITSYNTAWSNVSFPAPNKAITLEKAYETLFNNVKFGMEYIYHFPNINDYEKRETKLAYSLENINILMDANSGQMLNYDGTPVKSSNKLAYTDIKGNKAEEAIKTLIEMGIMVPESTTFAPESNMLQKDLVKIIVNSLQDYYPVPVPAAKSESQYDNYYSEAIRRKIINENEKNPDAVMTNQDIARMTVRALNYGVLAEKGNMFAANFKDASKIAPAYKGYMVIAAELGILPVVNSNINPTKTLTRGDAAQIIVNYLKCETSL